MIRLVHTFVPVCAIVLPKLLTGTKIHSEMGVYYPAFGARYIWFVVLSSFLVIWYLYNVMIKLYYMMIYTSSMGSFENIQRKKISSNTGVVISHRF